MAPQYLGLRLAIVKEYARLHWQNLINSAILPLTFDDESDYDKLEANDILIIENVRKIIQNGGDTFTVNVKGKGVTIACKLRASSRQREIMLVGGFSNWVKAKREGTLVKKSTA